MKNQLYIIALLFLIIFSACQNLQKPEFIGIENVKFNSVTLGDGLGLKLNGDALLKNPNNVGLDITGMELDAFIDGKKMGQIIQEISSTMPASSEFRLPLKFDIPLKELIKNEEKGFNLNFLKKKEILIRLEGIIKVNAAGITLNVPIGYEQPYEISLGTLFGG